MPTVSIVLILIAASLHALRDVMTKKSQEKLLFVWWMSFLSLILLSPVGIYFIIKTQPNAHALSFALGMGVIHASYWTFYSKAYEKGDLSHIYPIIHSAPAFVLLFGIVFLNEHPDLLGVLGIFSITIGLYLINIKRLSFNAVIEPIRSICKEEHTRFAFLALMFVVAFSLLDKVAVSQLHPMVYAFTMTISALSIFSIFIRKQIKRAWLNPVKNNPKNLVIAALFASISYPLTLFALQLTHASYVAAFRQISVVLAVVIGVLFLKESYTRWRILSTGLIFLGAVLVAV